MATCKCGSNIKPVKLRMKDGTTIVDYPDVCSMCEHNNTHRIIANLSVKCGMKGLPDAT